MRLLAKTPAPILALLCCPLLHDVSEAQPGPAPGIVIADGKHLVRDGSPFRAWGFNYYPKDHAWMIWEDYTSPETSKQIDDELDKGRSLGLNVVRIFTQYELFRDRDSPYLVHLQDFLNRLAERDMLAIVTLFDFYGQSPDHYSPGDYANGRRHIDAVVNSLGADNPAVLCWDLKNEPESDFERHGEEGEEIVMAWAREMIDHIRQIDPNHLITVGHLSRRPGTTDTYDPTIAAALAPELDVISVHYFFPERDFDEAMTSLRLLVPDRPFLLEEFGLYTLAEPDDPNIIPHTEWEQAAYYNALLSQAEAHGFAGSIFWTLNDFSRILPDQPDSEHCFGVLRNSQVSICEVSEPEDYSEKPAAGVISRHASGAFAYLDDFDGLVDLKQGGPSPGWAHNFQAGGALMLGFDPDEPRRIHWSHHPGKMALSKYVATDGQSITGRASSPQIQHVDIDKFPFLRGQVFDYSIHDLMFGSDSILHIAVQEETPSGTQITRLLAVPPDSSLPLEFSLDLREPPTNWTGSHTFKILLELDPVPPNNGYSATYELDFISISAVETCVPGPTEFCFNSSRFETELTWRDHRGNTGSGKVVPGGSENSGIFWFFDSDNWEMLVKVLDACSVNGHFWVFAAATTDVEYTLRVTDTWTGSQRSYFNALGERAPAITDTNAFETCSAVAHSSSARLYQEKALAGALARKVGSHNRGGTGRAGGANQSCNPSSTGLCLLNRRFEVAVDWRDFAGEPGSGRRVSLGSDSSGLFWFFDPDNWEMLVKVLDGCSVNDRFWVFAAATTDVEYTLHVTDTETGEKREYHNRLGTAADAITDTEGFATCP